MAAADTIARDERRALGRSLRRPAIMILLTLAVFFGGFGTWAYLAPLAGASIARATISPAGSRKTIQHLEGGIIESILVEDGDLVELGQPLVVLQDIQALSVNRMLTGEFQALQAIESRLLAEQTGATRIDFPDSLDRDQPAVAEAVRTQTTLFKARGAALESRRAILRQRIAQLAEEIAGLEAVIVSQDTQIGLIEEEVKDVRQLVRQGLERRPRQLALERRMAEIDGERAGNVARIARARQSIGETELQILGLDSDRQDAIAEEMATLRASRNEIQERLAASNDVLSRTVVTAPIAGTVFELRFRTTRGVIGPGEPILDIVPLNDDLIVEARVPPNDIDVVEQGSAAIVHLSAYRQRNMPRIDGVVRHLSADAITDPATGERYYLAQIEVSKESLEALDMDVELTPGMPAEAMILTGERTMFDYLVGPLMESVNRSFRER